MAFKSTVRLVLPALHPAQRQFVDDPHRIVVAACGTKTGKTFGLSVWLVRNAWNNYQSLNWWTAPTYKQAKIAFKLMGRMLPPHRYAKSVTDLTYQLLRSNGDVHSTIEFRSADNPDSLRGEGVKAVVVDEAGYWKKDAYYSVWTTLTQTRGQMRIISTPKGRNWFYEEFCKGKFKQEQFPEYAAYQLPTSANPHVPRESLIEAQRNLPKDVFRQEYLAEFLEDSAGVFRNIKSCSTSTLMHKPVEGRDYVIGVDLAKKDDYSVFCVLDRDSGEVVHLQRFNDVLWEIQTDRAIRLAKEWNNAYLMVDSTGVGDPIYDSIRSVYPHVDGFVISNNAPKVALIQKLQLAFERAEIHPPSLENPRHSDDQNAVAEIMNHELSTYGYEMSASGKFLFSAPEGFHDDMVIALALANEARERVPGVYEWAQEDI